MDRPHLFTPATAALAMLLLAGCTGCTGATQGGYDEVGTPGTSGLADPLFSRLGNGGYDVRSYALDLAYDPATRRLDGTAGITARATQDLSSFNLDLHGLTVDSVRVGGQEAGVEREGDELIVELDRPVLKGRKLQVLVRYSGEPRTIGDSDDSTEGWLKTPHGALALGEPAGSQAWFPGNHHPSDKATYTIKVTVPNGLQAISNGVLRDKSPKDAGHTTFFWQSDEVMPSFAATLAIGKYEVTEGTLPATGRPILTAVDSTIAAESRELLNRIPEITTWAATRFGAYPFGAVGAIVVPEGQVAYALETQTRPVIPSDQFDLLTLVHEIAHQWYGNSVTPKTWKDMWLNEGFATYAEWLWEEEFLDRPAQESFEEAFEDDANWAFPASPPSASMVFEDPVYWRGAMVLHKVRQSVGDKTFFRMLPEWARTREYGNASTADFTAFAEKFSGKDLSAVWDIWLHGEEKPGQP